MAIACQKRDTESNEKLIGRWKKKTQQEGMIKRFRKSLRFQRNDSLTKQKEGAIVRERYRAKRKKNQYYS